MCTPLAKLAIGLSATMATAFYYLAVAPPASAVDVCGPGNYSDACAPTQGSSDQSFSQIYTRTPSRSSTSIPEPGTAIALMVTGGGMICSSCRKRNKQVGPQR